MIIFKNFLYRFTASYTAAGKLESCILECLSEVQPFRIGVPHIDAAVIGKAVIHTLIGREQKVIEIAVAHVVVHDLAGGLLNVHIVRRIRQDEVCFLSFSPDLL